MRKLTHIIFSHIFIVRELIAETMTHEWYFEQISAMQAILTRKWYFERTNERATRATNSPDSLVIPSGRTRPADYDACDVHVQVHNARQRRTMRLIGGFQHVGGREVCTRVRLLFPGTESGSRSRRTQMNRGIENVSACTHAYPCACACGRVDARVSFVRLASAYTSRVYNVPTSSLLSSFSAHRSFLLRFLRSRTTYDRTFETRYYLRSNFSTFITKHPVFYE